jgi:ketosteroid isomerase-like protein
MSEENVEIVRRTYEAFNRRDWDAAFRYLDPDVEFTTPARGPVAGTFRGRDEIQGFLEEMYAAFEARTVEPEEIFESGEQQVAVVVIRRMRPEGSSAEIEARSGALWTIRDGLVASIRVFPSPRKPSKPLGCRSSRFGREAAVSESHR